MILNMWNKPLTEEYESKKKHDKSSSRHEVEIELLKKTQIEKKNRIKKFKISNKNLRGKLSSKYGREVLKVTQKNE